MDVSKGVVIYHRWGNTDDGILERFIVAINFSSTDQVVNIPFPDNGTWEDLLNNQKVNVQNWWLFNQTVNSYWGRVFYKKG